MNYTHCAYWLRTSALAACLVASPATAWAQDAQPDESAASNGATTALATVPAGDAAEPPSETANASNEANNPLTPTVMLSIHNYNIPQLSDLPNRQANVTLVRGLLPHLTFGKPQLFRFTLPVERLPTPHGGSDVGLGDFLMMDLIMFPGRKVSFGLGPVAVAPTADNDRLGSGKWQVGVTGAAVAPQKWGLLGALAIYQQSVAGKESRGDVRLLTIQPIAFVNLPKDFYIRSSGIMNFDLKTGDHYIPVGLGLGRIWPLAPKVRLNTFVEPQYSVIREGSGLPKWQLYAGFNVQIAVR